MESNNKLISEFMGVVFHDDENQYCDSEGYYIGLDLKYHTSWDWLMPVVEKCLRIGDNTDEWDNIFDALSLLSINAVYEEVVEFIKNQKNN
jgi:hypothetical protein